jgi:hypothetical protein
MLMALLSSSSGLAQEKTPILKVVIAAKKATMPARGFLPMNFGSTCRATSDAQSPYFGSYKSFSIAEMMSDPAAVLRITSYGPAWKNRDELRAHVLQVLSTETNESGAGEEWQEGVFTDIVGTIQFASKKEGAFEESGGHVCFNDHGGAVIWSRVRLAN